MLANGTKVRYSLSYLQKHRDAWQSCGKEPQKTTFRKYYEAKKSMIGIVESSNNSGSVVIWNDGSKSETISYYLQEIEV